MGLFDFVKEAGERVFGGAEAKARNNAETATALTNLARNLGIGGDDVQVAFDDGVATLSGTVVSQEAREKLVLLVGNTQGVAQVDDRLQVEKPAPEAAFYTVKSGDSLSKIAKTHYGDAMKYPAIFEANRPMLSDPDKIYPGQVLRIPELQA